MDHDSVHAFFVSVFIGFLYYCCFSMRWVSLVKAMKDITTPRAQTAVPVSSIVLMSKLSSRIRRS